MVKLALFMLLALAGNLAIAAGPPQKKKKAKVKPAYITSPPVRVKSHVRNGKVVRAHDRQRKPKT